MSTASWRAFKLDELGRVARGRSRHRPRNDPSLYGGPYPFFQTGDIKAANFYLKHAEQTYNEKGLAQSQIWPKGTLCITIAANIAESAFLDVEGCFPDSVVGFVADSTRADARFVKYSLDTMKRRMQDVSRGTTQDNLSLEKLLSFRFLIPPRDVQRRIADILSSYDDLIEVNTRRITVLEEMARGLFDKWFVEFHSRGLNEVQINESGGEKLPRDWVMSTLGAECHVILGGTPSRARPEFWSNGTVPWINSSKVNELRLFSPSEFITEAALTQSSTKMMPRGSTLVAITGATLGQVSVLLQPMCGNQSVVGLWDKRGGRNEYFYRYVQRHIERLVAKATGGAQQHINKGNVEEFRVVLPPAELMDRFLTFANPVADQIGILLKANATLRATRDLLLPKLISGEIDLFRGGPEVKQAAAE